MKIKRLYAENLYSFESLELEFDKYPGGTTLLLGRNLDNKTSNGSGKSSTMKALYFAFYGEDVAGANKSEVLRRGAPKGWYVTVEFEDRGHSFKIERFEGRKDKHSSGKGLNFFIDGELFNGEGGVSDTQHIINQKIRITPRLFLSSVYSQQDSKNNFLLETDTKKKELLSELLDLQVYAKAFDHIKKDIDELDKKRDERLSKIEALNSQIQDSDDQVKQLIEKRDLFTIEIKRDIEKEELDLSELSKRITSLTDDFKLKYNLTEVRDKISSLRDERSKLELELASEHKVSAMLEKIDDNIAQIDSEILAHKKEIETLNQENKKLDLFDFDVNSLTLIGEEKIQLELLVKELEENKDSLNSLNLKYQKQQSDYAQYMKDLEALEKEIKKLSESQDCPTCLRPYEEEHLVHVKEEIAKLVSSKDKLQEDMVKYKEQGLKTRADLDLLKEKVKAESSLKNKVKENQSKTLELNVLHEKFKQKEKETERNVSKIGENNKLILEKDSKKESLKTKKVDVEKIALELVPLKTRLIEVDLNLSSLNDDLIKAEIENNQFKQLETTIKSVVEQKEKVEQNILVLKEKPNPYGEMIANLERRTVSLIAKVDEIKSFMEKDNETMKYLSFWKVGFAPTGIRSFITDDVIDLLNRKVQDNLNDLFDGALTVMFDPESKNQKGIVSNKISTNLFLNGKETSKESLSGGEKRRAILATELALTEIAESRSGNKLNIRFLDEPFDGMDSNGQLQAFRLFARLSKDKDGFFVISHDENFQNMCSNVIYVVKKNEVSKIVDKATYNRYNIDTDEDISEQLETSVVLEQSDKKTMLAEKLREIANKNKKE